MAEEKLYEVISEANTIIKTLCEKYPDVLWRVRPNKIAVLGITNRERKEKCKEFFKINPCKGAFKALSQLYHVPISYIVEMYWSDWNSWTINLKEWMILKALLSISENDGKLIKPDCREFRIILDVVGVDWEENDALPSLTNGGVPFKLELRPAIETDEEKTEFEEKVDDVMDEINDEEKSKKIVVKKKNEDDEVEDDENEDE